MPNTDRLCPGCMKDNGGQRICSVCGYDADKNNAPDKLPVKFMIRDRYFVGKTLYSDSFSTVYLGFDMIENKTVCIKEYFPSGVALRNPDKTVSPFREAQFAYNEGLMEFIEVNKSFIGFPLSSLPSVFSVFEENATAYAICETVSGITLKKFLARNGGHLRWEQVRPLFLPLIDTLKALHDMGIVHGAISPDTVIVCRDGKLRLASVPINSVKNVKHAEQITVSPMLFDGYSAYEQYSADGIGKYTDVYGICSTLFTVLIGAVPPSAEERINKDCLTIPSHFADELPRQVLVSLANGLQIKPSERTADIETLKNELIYGETKENNRRVQRSSKGVTNEKKNVSPAGTGKDEDKKSSGVKYAAIAAGITAAFFLALALILALTVFKDQLFKKNEQLSNNDLPSIPSTASIGDVDSSALESKRLYDVPDLLGKYYSEIIDSDECKHVKIVLKNKEYSDKFLRGQICAQSIRGGQAAEHDSVLEITISLGPKEMKMPDVSGLTADKAKIELLKIGLLYNNIEIIDEYDSDSTPGIVLRQDPERGEIINAELHVRVFVNSYKGESENDN